MDKDHATNADVGWDDPVQGPFYLDTHIHIYACFDQTRMLDAACEHVSRYDDGQGIGVLALTELKEYGVFPRWRDDGGVGPWAMTSHGEPSVLFARRDDGRRLIVMAGRQIVTEGRLGVLAIGVDADFEDGRPLERSVRDAKEVNALPIVSYGMGKWRGRRGQIVDEVLEAAEPGEVAFGDIGVRPTWGPPPRQFKRAAERGLTILPGSDPLIIRASESVVCSFCVRVDGCFDRMPFARDFLAQVSHLGPHAPLYGDYLPSWRAMRDQMAMRVARRTLAWRGLPT